MIKDESDCAPATSSYGVKVDAKGCAHACNDKRYREFIWEAHGNRECKCAKAGCTLKKNPKSIVYRIQDDFSGTPAWPLAPSGTTTCDSGVSASEDQCEVAVRQLTAYHKQKVIDGPESQMKVGSGG